jgi:hypothetical protein
MDSSFRRKVEVTQWLFWQMGGLGPMAGQNHHFSRYAPTKIRYAIDRYVKETNRLYGVLDVTSPWKRRPLSRIHNRKLRTTKRTARSLHRGIRTG